MKNFMTNWTLSHVIPKFALLFNRNTLWSDKPRSSLGFFLIKLDARLCLEGGDVRVSLGVEGFGKVASFGFIIFLCTDGDVM